MPERSDDLLEPDVPETDASPGDVEDDGGDDDVPGLSAEQSLGLLPPD